MEAVQEYHILSLGGGVQSTTIYLMDREGYFDDFSLDAAVFADTGEDPEHTYRNIEWLQSLEGGAPIHVIGKRRLGEDILRGEHNMGGQYIPIPAFAIDPKTGKQGPITRQCTAKYKIEEIEKWIRRKFLGRKSRQHAPADVIVHQHIGFSTDEPARAAKVRRRFQGKRWTKPRFPLIEDQMSRTDCELWLRDRTPHVVQRSACVFCPYRSSRDWASLSEADKKRAIEIDESLRRFRPEGNPLGEQIYVHPKCQPLKKVLRELKPTSADDLFEMDCEGGCGL